jgi:hypothetical protein
MTGPAEEPAASTAYEIISSLSAERPDRRFLAPH